MTDRLVSRAHAEALVSVNPARQVSRVHLEALVSVNPSRQVSRVHVEVLVGEGVVPLAGSSTASGSSAATATAVATGLVGSGAATSASTAAGTAVVTIGVATSPASADSDAAAIATIVVITAAAGGGSATSGATGTGAIALAGHGAASAGSGASGLARTVAGGELRNRVGGRDRLGLGRAEWDPPVSPPPRGVPALVGRVIAQAFSGLTVNGRGRPQYDVAQIDQPAHRDRIVIGGRDVTYFRGAPTPFPGFGLLEPLLYGPTQVTFPQIAAAFEEPGVGDLHWCRPGVEVLIQRVGPEGGVFATDYRGVVVGYDADGSSLSLLIGGEATGRAALADRQVPLFPARHDLGYLAFKAVTELGLDFQPRLGPSTGITVRDFGGQGYDEYLNQVIAMSWTRAGNRWTIMPTGKGTYHMARKDTTTIDGTVYADDTRTVAKLTRDIAAEPNRIFMTGVTPAGMRVRFGAYPGLIQAPAPPYPFWDGRSFGEGTTDAATDTGDGVSVMIARLRIMGYVDPEDAPGGYDDDVAAGISELQHDAQLFATFGQMNPQTWRALYDLSATGYSLGWSRILPAAQLPVTRQWRRTASGAIIGRNQSFDATHLRVDRTIDAGAGFTRPQLKEWAQTELTDSADANWVGSIAFNNGGLIAGHHTPGTAITDDDLMRARALRPGMNLRLPLFAGGVTVHVSAVTVGADGTVSADVDTRARDALEVWEVIARNRDSRRSPYREWLRDHRGSASTKDSTNTWDEVGGVLGERVTVPAATWTVFPIVAGEAGTVASLRLATNPAAEFVVAIFGQRIYPNRLRQLIGNPLTKHGAKEWARESTRDTLDRDFTVLYVAGTKDQPCGYYPKQKTSEADDSTPGGAGHDEAVVTLAPLTGRWADDAGFSYYTPNQPVLWVAVFADRDTHVPAGRLMENQLEAGT